MKPPGTCEFRDGQTMVFSDSRRWVPYPELATELIGVALANGWGADDGLPVRTWFEGGIYLRILLGREYGTNALHPEGPPSLGTQFHIVWSLMSRRWELESMYVKTGRTRGSWSEVDSVFRVRSTITNNPVHIFSDFHLDEMEHRAC